MGDPEDHPVARAANPLSDFKSQASFDRFFDIFFDRLGREAAQNFFSSLLIDRPRSGQAVFD